MNTNCYALFSYGKFHIKVEGMECPICHTFVESGSTHDCELKETEEVLKRSASGSDLTREGGSSR
jgi:hypothetical protein